MNFPTVRSSPLAMSGEWLCEIEARVTLMYLGEDSVPPKRSSSQPSSDLRPPVSTRRRESSDLHGWSFISWALIVHLFQLQLDLQVRSRYSS